MPNFTNFSNHQKKVFLMYITGEKFNKKSNEK